jgi:hypothetical protein
MSPVEIVVTLAGVALAIAVNVWFFAPARPRKARGARRGGQRAGDLVQLR